MKKSTLPGLFLVLAASALAAPAPVLLKKGMAFQSAKRELHRGGWAPQAMHVKDQYSYTDAEKALLDNGVKGIEGCAVDRPVCIVHYTKGKACLRVIIWGEQYKDLEISYWDSQCPPEEAL